MYKILFIDDDRNQFMLLRNRLPENIYLFSTEGSGGLDIVRREHPDLVLLDWKLQDMDGLEVLKRIKSMPDAPPVIMLTGYTSIDYIVKAMKAGADDYVTKPYHTVTLRKIIQSVFYRLPPIPHFGSTTQELDNVVGESPSIRRVKDCIVKYASSELPVLIYGESGTGKELVARAIHELSSRKEGLFIARNCAAIPITILESELFGTERGAYTDAANRAGCFELAEGGTLFLDEIGEMDTAAQAKILRVLESGEVTRLGGMSSIRTNVRIVSATNRNLKEAIDQGTFRQDLFYRINTLTIRLPPLRERIHDVPLLALMLLRRHGSDKDISSAAREKLKEYNWPGNVRELWNVIVRADLLCHNCVIRPGHITFDDDFFR
jgi:two-component system, NtrC family, response regulator AtoC